VTFSEENSSLSESARPAPPGPVNRSTFFAQQEGNRAATWRLSLLCVLTVFCTGLVLSLVLAPPIYGLAVLGLALARKFGSVPPELWRSFLQAGTTFVAILQHFSNRPGPLPTLNILFYTVAAILFRE
jgi:hypothetical protein